MEASGKRAAQQQLTAIAVASYPGLTSLELAHRCRMCRYLLARRLSECEAALQVRRGQARKCSISGRTAHTWYPRRAPIQLELACMTRKRTPELSRAAATMLRMSSLWPA